MSASHASERAGQTVSTANRVPLKASPLQEPHARLGLQGPHHPDLNSRELSAAAARSKTCQVRQVTEDMDTNESEVISPLRRLTRKPLLSGRRCRPSLTPISPPPLPHALNESPGLQSTSPSPGSDLLKNSASSSASPRLRVKIHSLDLRSTLRLRNHRSFPN